ncbi:MAG: hypothetical protein NT113_13320 [Hyphomicrobiales bacterium]|nr:hypothetical protein [Hyphomicrobiales bacterium]
MTTKIEVIKLHQAWPHWTAKRLAQTLKCSEAYIRACRVRYGLDIPKTQGRENTIFNLGKAARKAGLTVDQLLKMGSRK